MKPHFPYYMPPQSSPSEPAILDTSQLASITGLENDAGQEMIARILVLFSEHAPVALDRLRGSNELSADDVASAAHALKSMCSNIGANRLFHACEMLENTMRKEGLYDPGDLIANVELELDIVLHHIELRRIAA